VVERGSDGAGTAGIEGDTFATWEPRTSYRRPDTVADAESKLLPHATTTWSLTRAA
jgi:hypothetical protein